MKKVLLIVLSFILGVVFTFNAIIKNIRISNVENNQVIIELFGNEFIYEFN